MKFAKLAAIMIIALLGLNGCGITDSTSRDSLNFDAAVVAADGAMDDLNMMHGPRLGGGIFPVLVGGRPDCPKTQDVFLCDPIEREGITYTRTIVYRDASGNSQTAYDETTTASIDYDIVVAGDRGRAGWSATISRSQQLTVSGLLDGTGQVTWSGSGVGSMDRSRISDNGDTRTYNVNSASQLNSVAVTYPYVDDSWPLSGTITRDLDMTRVTADSTSSIQKQVTIAFDGTQDALVTVDGESFLIDLSQRQFGPRHMRRGRR